MKTSVEETPPPPPTEHRWSSWPEAFCLDCGASDQVEICIAEHEDALLCIEGHLHCMVHAPKRCKKHVNKPCPTPGQGLADPALRRPRA